MSTTPANLTIAQAETILTHLPDNAVAAEEWLSPLVNKIAAALKTSPESAKTVDALALRLYELEKVINANAQAVSNLTNQFAPLTTPVKGVQLQGTGQLIQTAAAIPEGLKKSMTTNQHILHVVAGLLQLVFLLAGIAISFFPNIGVVGVGGGVTLVALISALKNIATPYMSSYGQVELQEQVRLAAVPVAKIA